ncbi:hypothetical protein [Campylobacter sp.]|uniref:hypothetical protein n=1 Tax=Campylobacter sp. TaxID=205 RepID=UPI0025BE6E6E|nr:hypothetical protein [Campylobacter sp.]
MKNILKQVFLFFLCIFLSSCALKNKINSQSVFVVLKTPQIKFADYGFLYEKNKSIIMELYNTSKPVLELKITDKICINGVCYLKQNFNKKFFNYEYYGDFLQELISKKQLYKGKNTTLTPCGFSQRLMSKNYDIFYEVCDNNMSFIDKQSKIKFSIVYTSN